ncbi:UDP-Glycosyltransferase/glycogen phosphorylase [Penicillium odoratum]|uniref:UDP-Glycosyltransferase/glycogen phosphorylase n=1 Tax=Penicillium odoratum TaxID=1167516 RepID=UPI0025491499|nr:UDP-Glycosyltransferase/glycogen phosphorylase [Penicillium odoratum]KAJ5776787.1 UDP-Glycosyltransferase/glycogen phosphorylase [Penicillium odoratum]
MVASKGRRVSASATEASTPSTHSTLLDQLGLEDLELAGNYVPPPAYGDQYGEIHDQQNGIDTSARLTDDGRVAIRINHFDRQLSQIIVPALHQHVQDVEDSHPLPPPYIPPSLGGDPSVRPPPPLNIVIQVVGSRGDVQPFVALGKVLKDVYGHRVRLATHSTFKNLVQQHGLEFFSIGGDPTRLMAFMVKNPGLRPGFRSVMSGDVGQQRRHVAEFVQGCWRSCYRADDRTEDEVSESSESDSGSTLEAKHFVADCIIANPPSFAHIHCAEKLGIPLHIMFTMPYSPTQAFPHPLANIQASNTDPQVTNYISYALIELLAWQGLGDIINRFRVKCLGLDPISTIWAPGMLQRLKIPHTYCWSPALMPKPTDWGSHISISGFFFLNMASDYTPVRDLQTFLNAGLPPVYVGFGSIVLDDPDTLTELIFAAARKTGQRVLLSKGWGGMGADELRIPKNVFILDNVPHDWLFKHVSCVVHHGGAGTTAAGIVAGRPTVVVPFFGDQPFWGAMIARVGTGPNPIPYKQLTADKLAEAINFCLDPRCLERAKELASKVAAERGSDTGAQSFHQFLDPDRLRCILVPSRPAAWRIRRTKVRLSAFAACTLMNAGLLDLTDLKLFRLQEHYTDEGPWDPISGGFTAFVRAFSGMTMGLADVPSETYRAFQKPSERSRQQSQASESATASRSDVSHVVERSNSSISSRRSRQSFVGEVSPTLARNPSNLSVGSTQTSNMNTQGQSDLRQGDPGRGSFRSRNESDAGKQPDMLRPTGVHVSKGAGRFVKAVVQGPVDMSVNFARGFHNMPRLWGDDTVRPQERVSDFKSGVRAVGREFGYGWYDGITGLVTQPWKGARKGGASGFAKGIGKGIGGFIAKPSAALFGILGHTMQGVNKEVQKLFGSDVHSYIIASRAAQGYEEWLRGSEAEKQDVINQWKLIQKDLKKKEFPQETTREPQEVPQRQQRMNSDSSASAWTEDFTSTTLDTDGSESPLHAANTWPEKFWGAAESTSSGDAADDHHMELVSRLEPQQHAHQIDRGLRDEITPQEKTEEEVVMGYIKKQSLSEVRHQREGRNRERAIEYEDDADDEDLQKALKLSMQEYKH